MTDVTTILPRSAGSVAAARRLVDDHAGDLTRRRREDVGLMVSELATNALRHGQGNVTIRIVVDLDSLTVEVSDEGYGVVAIAPAPGAAGGWGLRIVDELADGWGASVGSTRVWFRVLVEGALLPER
jgi:anti-sigma regulatory factor (Ser/Thr protein kinase)